MIIYQNIYNLLTISNVLINSNVKTVEEALKLTTEDGTLEDTITNKIAKIGEKISFRRFEILEKTDSENFGSYIHMNGKIGVLTIVEGASSEVAKDVSMHAAAMRPEYVKKEFERMKKTYDQAQEKGDIVE